ncbi:hypothetical protein EYF80_029097 [Liparis tanakae]|uniref:Uncharacterized protein n=1 Tax=Liparis tanakae TaxID=230148 RepID=A0A4Z2H6V4_9TELE|nr:hypothetical protein EYF80_029097 [Liparis tanakae]
MKTDSGGSSPSNPLEFSMLVPICRGLQCYQLPQEENSLEVVAPKCSKSELEKTETPFVSLGPTNHHVCSSEGFGDRPSAPPRPTTGCVSFFLVGTGALQADGTGSRRYKRKYFSDPTAAYFKMEL